MCEIQFIKNLRENLTPKDLREFKNLMSMGSVYNSDAWGIFNHNLRYSKKGSFEVKGVEDSKILNENFLVGHNRYTTSGSQNDNFNNHPFNIEDFNLIHNGVLSNFEELKTKFNIQTKIKTDSYVILWLINHYFKKSKLTNRTEKMAWAIQKTTLKIVGSYSVFVYDKIDKNLYYFKNSKTDFEFCLLDDRILLGSTNEENLNNIYLNKKYIFDVDDCDKIFKTPNSNSIYLINDKVVIKEIDVFRECVVKKIKVVIKPETQNAVLSYADAWADADSFKGIYDYDADALKNADADADADAWGVIDYNLNEMFGGNINFNIVGDEVKIRTKKLAGYDFLNSRTKKKFTYIPIEELLKYGI